MPACDCERRGQQIADTCRLTRKGEAWVVPSQSGNGSYTVRLEGRYPSCTCPDYELHANKCKHLYAVELVAKREVNADGSVTETRSVTVTETVTRPTYTQDWPNYDKAATREKGHFLDLLGGLCGSIPEPAPKGGTKGGRPPVPTKDAAFLCVYKVYSGLSARRFTCDVRDAADRGLIAKPVSYPVVVKAMESEALTPVLVDLIRGLPPRWPPSSPTSRWTRRGSA